MVHSCFVPQSSWFNSVTLRAATEMSAVSVNITVINNLVQTGGRILRLCLPVWPLVCVHFTRLAFYTFVNGLTFYTSCLKYH